MTLAKYILDDDPGQPWANLSNIEKIQRVKAYAYNWIRAFDYIYLEDAPVTQLEKEACTDFRSALEELLYGDSFDPETLDMPDVPTITSTPLTPAIVAARIKRKRARIKVANIPDWVDITDTAFLAWMQTNIHVPLNATLPAMTNATQIRNSFIAVVDIMKDMATVIENAGLLEIAIRDDRWPNLSD
jgi:hypothetical protein